MAQPSKMDGRLMAKRGSQGQGPGLAPPPANPTTMISSVARLDSTGTPVPRADLPSRASRRKTGGRAATPSSFDAYQKIESDLAATRR